MQKRRIRKSTKRNSAFPDILIKYITYCFYSWFYVGITRDVVSDEQTRRNITSNEYNNICLAK